VSAPYAPEHQGGIRWDEPQFKLKDLINDPLLSEQDKTLPRLKEIL
jgi:dTDP-4-dehydrorhamnose 3,5-epimerase